MSAVMAGVGIGLSAYGNWKSGQDAAEMEEQNAIFLREQAQHAEFASMREEGIFRREARDRQGHQISTLAKAGVDISGSPLHFLSELSARDEAEVAAIRQEGRLRYRLASERSQSARRHASDLRTAGLLGAGGSILTGASESVYRFGNKRGEE